MEYLNAFLCGGILCAVGQIIIDKTQLTPARILTGYVVVGVLLSALLLGEARQLPPQGLAALALICAGILTVNKAADKKD